tara:strand:- start:5486 stop:6280 length:795 start_codon:yes stop_codon:yes gene_type:complete
MKNILKTKTALLIVFISIISSLFMGFIVLWIGKYYTESYQKLFQFISIIVGQSLIIAPLFLYLKYKKIPIISSIRLYTINYNTMIFVALFSLGLIVLSDELDRIIQIFFPAPEYITNLNNLFRPETIFGGFLLFIAVVILAPIGEEIVFRGFLQQVLEKNWKDITRAVLFTALVFSIIHMNPYWFVQIYILGVILGFLSWKTQSIIAPLILHGLNNGVALLLSFSNSKESNIYIWNDHVAPWVLVVALGCVLIGFNQINQLNVK